MGNNSGPVQPLFSLVQPARGGGGFVLLVALLLGCSGKVEDSNGSAGDGGAGAGRPGSSVGGAKGSFAGDEATAGLAGLSNGGAGNTANGGVGNTANGGAGGGIISGAGRGGALGHAGSSGGSSTAAGSLGATCANDAQCGTGLVCATADNNLFGTGGPSNGMCTKPCTAGGTECSKLSAGADCFDFGPETAPRAYCLAACELGDPADLQTKCAGRADVVCVDLGDSSVLPFCVPHCRSDAECGSGSYCDKSSLLGLCSKTKPPAGDPVGTPCTPGATTNTCAAYCLRTSADGVTPVTGNCVELCSGGSECMYGSGSSPAPGGFCGGTLSDTFGELNLGYCLSNCSCTADCKIPGDLCRKWPAADASLVSVLGAPGVCYPTVAESVELTCSQGGSGGAG